MENRPPVNLFITSLRFMTTSAFGWLLREIRDRIHIFQRSFKCAAVKLLQVPHYS